MTGAVRTKEKCPKCGGKFQGEPLACPTCLTTPRRYFVDFYWKGRIKLYLGRNGRALDSWGRASRLLNAMRHEVDQDKFDPKDYDPRKVRELLFNTYAVAWLCRRQDEQDRGHLSKGYLEQITSYVHRYFIPFFKKTPIRELRAGDLEDFKNQLPTSLSPKTVYNILGVLHKLFQDAFRRRDILLLPDFPQVRPGDPVIRWITETEQERLLSRVRRPVYRAFFLFLMKQGCRPGEARALKWQDVDLKQEQVIIRAAMDRGQYRPSTKEKNVKYLPLHPAVIEALRQLPRSLSGYVFINQAGRPLSKTRILNQWTKAAKAAGLNIGCYQGTKHSLCCQAANRGVPLNLLAEFCGHKDPRSTKKYAEIRTETLRRVWGLSPECVPNLSPGQNEAEK